MNCKEFKKNMVSGTEPTEEQLIHLNQCESCKKWLKNEISTAPEGISKETWDKSLNSCLANREKTAKDSENEPNKLAKDNAEEKSFLSCYLSGLKYGLAFGLAMVIGFAIIQNRNEPVKKEEKTTLEMPAVKKIEEKALASDSLLVEKEKAAQSPK